MEIYAHLRRGTLPVSVDSAATIGIELIEQRSGFLAEPAASTERAGHARAARKSATV